MKKLRTYSELTDATASDIEGQLAARSERLRSRLDQIRHTLGVMSGKGGVGKSALSANLAALLARDGLAVGVLDADINGPSMARLMGVERKPLKVREGSVEPAVGAAGVKVMSMDLLLTADDTPVEWEGPTEERFLYSSTMEANALREFLADTDWGELDYLILDLAPGTDTLTTVHDLLPGLGGVLAVTLPSQLSRFIVAKSIKLARVLGCPVIGYVENMSGYVCPDCGAVGPLFEPRGEALDSAERLAALPFDPQFGASTDAGKPDALNRPDGPVGSALREVAVRVRSFFEGEEE